MKGHIFLLLLGASVTLAYHDPSCASGRHVIVHLFEWRWTDIAAECERFLGPKGFCGVQVSPPSEHVIVTNPPRPWWERYQPVSYKMDSRSGTEYEFIDMVQRCNNANVRIYVDGVINHMAGVGQSGHGSAGSWFDSDGYTLSFPGVPYGVMDFNDCAVCGTSDCTIHDYNNPNQVRNCRLVGLADLKLGSEYVRGQVVDYMNHLVNIGVAGYRLDASKHMWPSDLQAMLSRLNNLNSAYFPSDTRPFIYQEVIDLGGEGISIGEYTDLGRVTEFKYSKHIGEVFRGHTQLKYLVNFGSEWGMVHTNDAVVFVDNHDNQRGHGAGGASVITFFDDKLYKIANAFMLAHPYGFTRLMSSYHWNRDIQDGKDQNDWVGPPSQGDGTTNNVPINPDGTCGGGWMCEHRWRQITNMVAFRNEVTGQGITHWWDNGNNQIAFSRGGKGFIAINNENNNLDATIKTDLPKGKYCDIISGNLEDGSCTGTTVDVDSSGARISISGFAADPVVAIHLGSRVDDSGDGGDGGDEGGSDPDYQRTVVLIHKDTEMDQDLFLTGGIDHDRKPGCTGDAHTSECAISIKHRDVGSSSHYEKYNSWRVGDTKLDWYGSEPGQGQHNWVVALGSPTVWTTNVSGSEAYHPVNEYGDHYWYIDMDMDCTEADNGWFEFKARLSNNQVNGGWEGDISQDASCEGSAGGSVPFVSDNHVARCGKLNVYEFGKGNCLIQNF